MTDAKRRFIAAALCLPILSVAASYVAGLIFVAMVWKGKMPFVVTPLTIFTYAHDYWGVAQLRPQFLTAIAIAALPLVALLLVMLFYRPRATLYGDGRWANGSELKKAKMLAGGGLVLGQLPGGDVVCAHPEHHVDVRAPTGQGKGTAIVLPNLYTWPGSLVVNDIKGENFEMSSRFRQKFGQDIFVFNPSDEERRTHRWNPFTYVDHDHMLRGKGIQRIAAMLWPPSMDDGEPWKPGARNLFFACCVWHMEKGMDLTLPIIGAFGAIMDEKAVKKEIDDRQKTDDPFTEELVVSMAKFLKLPDKTKESIRNEFNTGLELVTKDRLLSLALSGNDFDFRELRSKAMSIYVVTPGPDLGRLRGLLNLFFQQASQCNTDVEFGQDPSHRHQLMFMLDEFSSLGELDEFMGNISFYRSYGVKLITIYQSKGQVIDIYGEQKAQVFFENHKTRVAYTPVSYQEAKDISEELPKTTSYSVSKSGKPLERKSVTHSEAQRALLLPDEVRLFPDDELMVFAPGIYPARLQKMFYFSHTMLLPRLKMTSPYLNGIKGIPKHEDFKKARMLGELMVEIPQLAIPSRAKAATVSWEAADAEPPKFRAVTAVDDIENMDLSDVRVNGKELPPAPPKEATDQEKKDYANGILDRMFD